MQLCCIVKGKSADEIPSIFGISTPFTPEEEALVDREYPWLKEAELPYAQRLKLEAERDAK